MDVGEGRTYPGVKTEAVVDENVVNSDDRDLPIGCVLPKNFSLYDGAENEGVSNETYNTVRDETVLNNPLRNFNRPN